MWLAGMAVAVAGMVGGCANLPRTPDGDAAALQTQARAAGATIPGNDSVLAMLVKGALGPSNGALVAADWIRIQEHQSSEAIDAASQARRHPATRADVGKSSTADLNGDGFVTLDEIVAMQNAGLSQNQIINLLEQTFYHFELTPPQRRYLRDQGIAPEVLAAIDHGPLGQNARTASLGFEPR
jgi:hypothetical protein